MGGAGGKTEKHGHSHDGEHVHRPDCDHGHDAPAHGQAGHVHGPDCGHDHHHDVESAFHATDVTLDAARLIKAGDAESALARLAKEEPLLRAGAEAKTLALAENLLRKGEALQAQDKLDEARGAWEEALALAKSQEPHGRVRKEADAWLAVLNQARLHSKMRKF